MWLEPSDCALSKADLQRLELESSKLRTRTQCETALTELGLEPCSFGGSVKDMRNQYVITSYQDLWPLRQVG